MCVFQKIGNVTERYLKKNNFTVNKFVLLRIENLFFFLQIDCLDGSDESEKCETQICSSRMFRCENGNCVDKLLICNGYNDCGDNSDEGHCINFKKVESINCNDTEYKCQKNETCIPLKMRYFRIFSSSFFSIL